MAKCWICDRDAKEEDLCYGCGQIICDKCDETEPTGKHDPMEHQA